jgi:ABC-type polar amino acid transport system ATPase subunit
MRMLRASGLSKSHGGRIILREVSLSVVPGEAIAIMGASGTGKTTLLRCLDGFEQADAGTVSLGEVTVDHREPPERFRPAVLALRRRLGFVFQSWHLFANRTVLENVMEGPVFVRGTSADAARAHAQQLLDQVGVAHRAAAFPHQLSGGEQQRAAIARALAMEPEVLLLDEPTSALDDARAERLVELLRSLAANGLALVAVTHDATFAQKLGGKVYRLDEGRLIGAPTSASSR